ncbi:MAG: prephenate dehydratase [Eggerthellaceae bacterium]
MSQPTTIAFLGPIGTYSDEAARLFAERMGCNNVEYVECPSFNEVHDAVDRGRCEFGVMPIENSLEGVVTATLDTLTFKGGVSIMGSAVLDIHHCLLTHPDTELPDVKTIVSHPQALAQCRRYLNEHFPSLARVTSSSTAEGARAASQDKTVAGIASSFAGELFSCKTHERNIEDHYGNQTRFVLIARQGHKPVLESDRMKTTLAMHLNEDRPGSLLMILSELNYADVNLTMIQSRPTKQGLGDYLFFVDIEGSPENPAIKTALDCLRLKLREVKVLGTYPAE